MNDYILNQSEVVNQNKDVNFIQDYDDLEDNHDKNLVSNNVIINQIENKNKNKNKIKIKTRNNYSKSNGRKVMRDTPLAELTIRKYEIPYDSDTRNLLRKFCLSIGLLQPGDSRDIIVDVFHILLQAKKEKMHMNSEQIRKAVILERENLKLPMLGIAASNVRRQIKRLRDIFLVEKIKNEYKITEFGALEETFKEKIESYLLPSILGRLKMYIRNIDNKFQ
jgi:hypothetical protein